MSPYMRAYQAGIKLAELEWMSKVADGPEEGSSGVPLMSPVSDESYDLDFTQDEEFTNLGTPETDPAFNEPDSPDLGPGSQPSAPAQRAEPVRVMADPTGGSREPRGLIYGAELAEGTPQAAPAVAAEGAPRVAPSQFSNPSLTRGQSNLFNTQLSLEPIRSLNMGTAKAPAQRAAPAPAGFQLSDLNKQAPRIGNLDPLSLPAQQAAPRFGAPSMTGGQSNLFNTQLSFIDPGSVSLGNRPQAAQAAQAALVQRTPATRQELNMSMPEQELNMSMPEQELNMSMPEQELNMSVPEQELNMSVLGQQAAPVQQAPAQEAAADPFNFNVVRGGYGKQFRALQDAFKQRGQAEALEGFTYRDMAQAMGNRGLRVNDRFDANALLQRMRNIQDQGMGVMGGTQFAVQRQQGRGKQRGYKDIVNFRTLQQQRAATNRAIPSQSVNMPQARPGQFSNTQLESPMLAPVQSPPLSLGHNRPAIGTSGFYNPQSAAKTSPTGLNMRGDFRLNTPKQVRPFDQYED